MKKQKKNQEIEKREKGVDKKGFIRYFKYEPSPLVIKLQNQNKHDLKKNLDKIKAQKIKLDKDERNNTNNKNENDRHNMILSPIDKIYQYFEYKFLSKPDTQSDRQQPDQQQ